MTAVELIVTGAHSMLKHRSLPETGAGLPMPALRPLKPSPPLTRHGCHTIKSKADSPLSTPQPGPR